jgi:hypothetical protein
MKEVFIYFIRILSSYLLTVNTVFLHYVDCKKKNTKLIQYQNFLRKTSKHGRLISVFLSLDRHQELLEKISRKLDESRYTGNKMVILDGSEFDEKMTSIHFLLLDVNGLICQNYGFHCNSNHLVIKWNFNFLYFKRNYVICAALLLFSLDLCKFDLYWDSTL